MPPNRDPLILLQHMRERLTYLLDNRSQLLTDLPEHRTLRTVERELQIVGEALYQLERIDPTLAARFDGHRRIIDMRHVLVHGYDIVKLDRLIMVLAHHIEPLHQQVIELMRELEGHTNVEESHDA
jgi:uncharacterized protein with HEPN domain